MGVFLATFQLSAETLPPANTNYKGLWVSSFESNILGADEVRHHIEGTVAATWFF